MPEPYVLQHWKLVKDLEELEVEYFAVGTSHYLNCYCPQVALTWGVKDVTVYAQTYDYMVQMGIKYGVGPPAVTPVPSGTFWCEVASYYDDNTSPELGTSISGSFYLIPKAEAIYSFLQAVDAIEDEFSYRP